MGAEDDIRAVKGKGKDLELVLYTTHSFSLHTPCMSQASLSGKEGFNGS